MIGKLFRRPVDPVLASSKLLPLLLLPLFAPSGAPASGLYGPKLDFTILSHPDSTPIVQWKLISLPGSASEPLPASGGMGNVPVACYSGPVYQLSASGLGTNAMRVEASTNLVNWQPFPGPGFQLTFYSTSTPFLNVPEDRVLFFRGVVAASP